MWSETCQFVILNKFLLDFGRSQVLIKFCILANYATKHSLDGAMASISEITHLITRISSFSLMLSYLMFILCLKGMGLQVHDLPFLPFESALYLGINLHHTRNINLDILFKNHIDRYRIIGIILIHFVKHWFAIYLWLCIVSWGHWSQAVRCATCNTRIPRMVLFTLCLEYIKKG